MYERLKLNSAFAGQAVFVVWSNPITGQAYNGTSYVSWSAANLILGASSFTADSNGFVTIGNPPTLVEAGAYQGDAFLQAGGSPNVSDLANSSIGSTTYIPQSLSGLGENQLTVNVIDSATSAPITGATVTIANTAIATTNTSGNATLGLNAGAYTLMISASGYVNAAPRTVAVSGGNWVSSGSTILSVPLTAIVIPSPAPPGMVNATAYCYDVGVEPNTPVSYRRVDDPSGSGGIYSGRPQTAIPAPDTGYICVQLWQNAEYEFWYGRGQHVPLETGTTDCQIPSLLSAQFANF